MGNPLLYRVRTLNILLFAEKFINCYQRYQKLQVVGVSGKSYCCTLDLKVNDITIEKWVRL